MKIFSKHVSPLRRALHDSSSRVLLNSTDSRANLSPQISVKNCSTLNDDSQQDLLETTKILEHLMPNLSPAPGSPTRSSIKKEKSLNKLVSATMASLGQSRREFNEKFKLYHLSSHQLELRNRRLIGDNSDSTLPRRTLKKGD